MESPFEVLAIKTGESILIYGIGNVGRQDDGLGHRMIENLEQKSLPKNWQLDANYQLNAEVSLQISGFDVILFVDADKSSESKGPFWIQPIVARAGQVEFSSHAMSAASVVALCEELYHKKPRCYYLGIPGSEWEIGEGLGELAEENLRNTQVAFEKFLETLA